MFPVATDKINRKMSDFSWVYLEVFSFRGFYEFPLFHQNVFLGKLLMSVVKLSHELMQKFYHGGLIFSRKRSKFALPKEFQVC